MATISPSSIKNQVGAIAEFLGATTTTTIALADIIVESRLRSLRPAMFDDLAESVAAGRLLHPITVRMRASDGAYILAAGWHRLEAARKLGRDAIEAIILGEIDPDQALLAEIDENLIRADLTPAERAAHQAKRKEIYERRHPETLATKHGGPGRAKKKTQSQNEIESAPAFVDDAARKTGKSRATVAREAARGAAIPDVAALAGTSLDKSDELDALAKLPAAEQHKLAERAKAGEKVSAKTHAKKIKRDAREQALAAKQLALPNKRYGVIVADPEWRFEPWSRQTGLDRAADNHYRLPPRGLHPLQPPPSSAHRPGALAAAPWHLPNKIKAGPRPQGEKHPADDRGP